MVFRLVHQLGGTHYRTIVDGGFRYQTFDRSLLVMAPEEVLPLKTMDLGKRGETGPAVDMLLQPLEPAKRLWIVIEDDELLEVSLVLPQAPGIVNRTSAAELGIRPRRLSMVDDELYVSGHGGVVRVRDRQKIFSSEQDVSRVARGETGLMACVDRQVIRLADGKYLGSATDFPMATAEHVVFVRQAEKGGHVGLMTPQVREVDAHRATVAVPGNINSVRMVNNRLWIATDQMIVGYAVGDDSALVDPIYIDVLGATDLSLVNDDLLAISGTFGRAVYRMTPTDVGDPPAFVKIHREPSRLSMAVSDGRHILAGSAEGLWMYLINSRVDLTVRQFENAPPPPKSSATVATGVAKISEDRLSLTITSNSVDPATGEKLRVTHSEPGGSKIFSVEAVGGDFWVGHERGITVLHADPPPLDEKASKKDRQAFQLARENRVAGRIRFDGPVLYIYPLLVGGGASFVSEFGGFGVAKFVEEPIVPAKR